MLSVSVCDDCANFWNAFTSFAHWQNILYTQQQQQQQHQKTTTEPNRATKKSARKHTKRENENWNDAKWIDSEVLTRGKKKLAKSCVQQKARTLIGISATNACTMPSQRTVHETVIIFANITRYSVLPLCWCCCRYRYGCW